VGDVPVVRRLVQRLGVVTGQVGLDVEGDFLDGAGERERGPVGVGAVDDAAVGLFGVDPPGQV
jgi:hypothetical protein